MREYTKLLLVDDEPALRELLKTYLNMAGYNNIDIANDGELALDMINQKLTFILNGKDQLIKNMFL